MRKAIAFLLILALLLLPGCGNRTSKDFTPNRDGTVGRFRWGMTLAQACRVDERIAARFPTRVERPDENVPEGELFRLPLEEVTFLGHPASLVLWFQRLPEPKKDDLLRLTRIDAYMFLKDGEPDYIPRVGDCFSGNTMASTGEDSWASPKTLEDKVGRQTLEKTYPTWSAESLDRIAVQPLYSVHAESLNGPRDVFGSTRATDGDREFNYIAVGYYAALAEALGK